MQQTQPEIQPAPIGDPVENWAPRPRPEKTPLAGAHCTLEPVDPERHAADLHAANIQDRDGRIWTYLAYGPFATLSDYIEWMHRQCLGDDPLFFAVVDRATQKALGVCSYLRLQPEVGVIEVGHINFAPALQRTVAATEAMYLMMRHVFDDLGYRRYEWKCDALNAKSRRAALRLGFSYEGTFRQATMYKNRNRDTAWFAMIDKEWPALKGAFTRWLDADNFHAGGAQKQRLSALTRTALGR